VGLGLSVGLAKDQVPQAVTGGILLQPVPVCWIAQDEPKDAAALASSRLEKFNSPVVFADGTRA